jgi:ABC-type transport system substrate-binding protein
VRTYGRVIAGAAIAALLALSLAASGGARGVAEGGTFRVTLGGGAFDFIDPALAYQGSSWAILNPVCATLMTYLDKPPPAGYRLVTDVAKDYPKASQGGRTWTFTLRSGFRFSDGTPVRASAFAHAIDRTLARGDRFSRQAVHAGHRRGEGRPRRQGDEPEGGRGSRQHSGRSLQPAGSRLSGADDDAVLLCSSAGSSL